MVTLKNLSQYNNESELVYREPTWDWILDNLCGPDFDEDSFCERGTFLEDYLMSEVDILNLPSDLREILNVG